MSYHETVKVLTGRPGYVGRATVEDAEYAAAWHVGNNGSGRRPWFVLRTTSEGQQTHNNRGDVIVRYGSREAAQAMANALNLADPSYAEYWQRKESTP